MNVIKHGLSISIERFNEEFFLSFKVVGKLTHEDYEEINSMIDAALEGIENPRVKIYIDASEFEGWELRALWDDFKLDLKRGNDFDKVAVFGNKKWQKYATKVGSWFISGEMKFFEDSKEALDWLHGSSE